jgi:serine/threonine protein kinase
LIGNVLDKYEVLSKIGEGGMATVYRGRHLTLGREVAIKVLHPHLSASPRNRQRFAREARAIEHLDHENILKIFDYSGTDAENCYIVTELVDGETLQALVQDRTRIPSEITAVIGMKLALALEYAHELGIIHRDLKLENVMIRRDGTLKLMDFGIARFLDEVNLTITGALVGSPAYMSPEQAMEKVVDIRSDLFSLGTVLFHLVTGQLPFTGGNPSLILRNIIEGNRPSVIDLAPDVSGPLGDLIEHLLQVVPDDRPQSAREVAMQLLATAMNVDLEPTHPQWALDRWLREPNAYEDDLSSHLRTHLMKAGRERLEARDHLSALRLFNRLLSMDEDNAEVLDLVQTMHGKVDSGSRPQQWVAGLSILVVACALAWTMWPDGSLVEIEQIATPSTPAMRPPKRASVTSEDDAPPPETQANQRNKVLQTKTPVSPTRPMPPKPDIKKLTALVSAPPPPEADQSASVLVTVPGSWGDIYIDGKLMGRTGTVGRVELTPGTHVLGIKNDHALPYHRKFTVASGEAKTIEVTALQRKPARFRIEGNVAPDCNILVDSINRGTIAGLSYTFRVREPDKTHQFQLQCPDGTQIQRTLSPVSPGALVPLLLNTP